MEQKKTPIPLQIISVLLVLGGIAAVIIGVPMLLVFGVGIIPIALGGFTIKYAVDIYNLRHKGYNGIMVIFGIGLVLSILSLAKSGFDFSSTQSTYQTLYLVVVIALLYYYRNRFTS